MLTMMRNAGDRLLSALVPQATAGACCPPDPWTEYYCDVTDGLLLYCHCSHTCSCGSHCTCSIVGSC